MGWDIHIISLWSEWWPENHGGMDHPHPCTSRPHGNGCGRKNCHPLKAQGLSLPVVQWTRWWLFHTHFVAVHVRQERLSQGNCEGDGQEGCAGFCKQ